MTTITYDHDRSSSTIWVRLEDRNAGYIREVQGGFQYVPRGQKDGGEVFDSVGAVKRSIEGTAQCAHCGKVGPEEEFGPDEDGNTACTHCGALG